METIVLKGNGEFKEFNQAKRDRKEGLFIVFRKEKRLLLLIDESGKMFSLALRVAAQKQLGLRVEDVIVNGFYRFRETRFGQPDAAWAIGLERRAGNELPADIFAEVADKICGGATWMRE